MHRALIALIVIISVVVTSCGEDVVNTPRPTLSQTIQTPAGSSQSSLELTDTSELLSSEPSGITATLESTQVVPPSLSLPSPLYFIGTDWQLWRLEPDGKALTQITDEPKPVLDFDISPSDGSIAYITNNLLIHTDALGKGRTVLVEGPEVTGGPDATWNWTLMQNPRWDKTGERLVYGLNGIQLVQPAYGGKPTTLLSSQFDTSSKTGKFFWPQEWSPDGARLLVIVTTLPTSTGHGVLSLDNGSFIEIRSAESRAACCNASWSLDGKRIYYASDIVIGTTSGMWQANAGTGASEVLIPGEENGTLARAAYPRQLGDGMLYFFLTSYSAFSPDRLPLTPYRADPANINDRSILNSNSYLVTEALWAEDGRGAMVVDISVGRGESYPLLFEPFIGRLVWIEASDNQTIELPISGRKLHWGQED